MELKRYDDAEPFIKRTVDIYTEKLRPAIEKSRRYLSLAWTLRLVYFRLDRLDDAVAVGRREVEVRSSLGDSTLTAQAKLNLSISLSQRAAKSVKENQSNDAGA